MAELLVWPALLGYSEAAFAYAGGLRGPGRYGRLGIWGVRIGWLAQTALLAVQAATSDGFPWATWAGALNLLCWLVVTGYLAWGSNPRYRLLGLGVMPVAAALLVLAWFGRRHRRPRRRWGRMDARRARGPDARRVRELHRRRRRRSSSTSSRSGGSSAEMPRLLRLRLPPLEALDRLAARVALVGLALLSAGIVVGLTRLESRRDRRRDDGDSGAVGALRRPPSSCDARSGSRAAGSRGHSSSGSRSSASSFP